MRTHVGLNLKKKQEGVFALRMVRLFYAAPLVLSLMLGKFCVADADAAAQYANAAARSSTANAAADVVDRDFLAARAALDSGNLRALEAARARLAAKAPDHPLLPYATYWWYVANLGLSASFATTEAGNIQSFLDKYPDTPFADGLRREWLKALGKQDAWDLFAPAYMKFATDDAEIICQSWRYRLTQDDREALSEAKSAWNAGRGVSEACYDVFAKTVDAGLISTAEAWLRVRKLLEGGQLDDARRSANLIKKVPAFFERTTAVVNMDAARYLAREKVDPKSRASVELYLFAINRLAKSDAEKAAEALAKRVDALSKDDAAYAWSQIGLYGAMQHQDDALAWFAKASEASPSLKLTDTQAAWKVRAALRAADWRTVQDSIEAMSTTEKRDPAWRYWLARAESTNGNREHGKLLLDTLSRENNFYGLMAAEELGTPFVPSWQSMKPQAADLEQVRSRPGIGRALALYRLDMKPEALREWQYAIRNMNDQELLAASAVASEANVPDRAINTAERTLAVHDFTQRFPLPHRDELKNSAAANQLSEAWVYGLIRQESRFMADARSRVGAIGLMQLMPSTARWAAKQVGLKNFSADRAGDVAVNLNLGSFYLRHVLDDLGHPVLATAAYNAGPGRARRWRAEQPLEGAIYAESIPFSETRDYVKKVMSNTWFYANRLGSAKISLKEIMGTVPGRSAPAAGASAGNVLAIAH